MSSPNGSDDGIIPLRGVIRGGQLVSLLDHTGKELGAPATVVKGVTGVIEIPAIAQAANTGKTRVLVVGSSNASGTGAGTQSAAWANLLATALSATHDFYNVAIPGKSVFYWTDQDPTGATIAAQGVLSNLELAISQYQPHIVIGSFGITNGFDGSSTVGATVQQAMLDYVGGMMKANGICEKQGIRFIGTTPYGGNACSNLSWKSIKTAGDILISKGAAFVDFYKVYFGGGTTIPASIDSGDGQHVNAAGHLNQFQMFPLGLLKLKDSLPSPNLQFPLVNSGLLFPNETATATPLEHATLPAGSWTIAFRTKASAVLGVRVVLAWQGSNGGSRIRAAGSGNAWDIQAAGATLGPGPTFAALEEQWLAVTYNAVAYTMSFYVNGVAVASDVAVPGGVSNTFTGFGFGGHITAGTYNQTGCVLRNLSIHACALNAGEIKRLYGGDIENRSLVAAYPLLDGYNKIAEEMLINIASNDAKLVTHIAIP